MIGYLSLNLSIYPQNVFCYQSIRIWTKIPDFEKEFSLIPIPLCELHTKTVLQVCIEPKTQP